MAVATAMVVSMVSGIAAGADKSVTLHKADGTSIVVRDKGAAAGDEAFAMAAKIAAFDSELKSSKPPEGDAEVIRAMQQIAAEEREDAVETLDRAIRIANRTAGGLDNTLLNRANEALSSARRVMRAAPPPSLFVRTEITVAEPRSALHYQTAAEYKHKEEFWHSYNLGEKLRIGRYMFRARPGKAEAREYREMVLVLADPTAVNLQPVNEH
jgi:hypothetical protein